MFCYRDLCATSSKSVQPKGSLISYPTTAGWQIADQQGDLYFAEPPQSVAVCLPSAELAAAFIKEWPARKPSLNSNTETGTDRTLSQIAKLALLGGRSHFEAHCQELVGFLHSDTVAYWQRSPDHLHQQQQQCWGGLLDWCRDTFHAAPTPEYGLKALVVCPALQQAVHQFLSQQPAFALAAMAMITPISGSIILSLAQCCGQITAPQAYSAANLETLVQQQQWGNDPEATERLARQHRAFVLADLCFRSSNPDNSVLHMTGTE